MKVLNLKTIKEVRIMNDPYRKNILDVMRRNNGIPMTVKQIAKKLGEPHSKVHYHLKKMEGIEAVVLDHTETINGIVAKYYKVNFETINISYKNDNESDLKESDFTDIIQKVFDEKRDACVEFYKTADEEEKKKGNFIAGAHFFSETTWYDEETYNELMKELQNLANKYKNKEKKEGALEKTLFISLFNEKK